MVKHKGSGWFGNDDFITYSLQYLTAGYQDTKEIWEKDYPV